jgi:hypothetical protein
MPLQADPLAAHLNQTDDPWHDLTFYGAYDASRGYPVHAAVTFGGALYVCRRQADIGAQPDTHTANWRPVPAGV